MNQPSVPPQDTPDRPREELLTALFANLVMQQANMALMFLGQLPHPQTGQAVVDLEAAQLFIDNLEMIERKTRGNLTKDETGLLQESLTSTRMTFVQVAAKTPAPSARGKEAAPAPPPSSAPPAGPAAGAAGTEASAQPPPSDADADAEDRRKFVKKY